MRVTKRLDLPLLGTELTTAGVPFNALGTIPIENGSATELFTYDEAGVAVDLPPAAAPVVDAHVAPPLAIEYAQSAPVSAVTRTTDGVAKEIYRFSTVNLRRYEAALTITGIDAGTFVSKTMEGRFVWKRTTAASAVMVGITVVSDLKDTAAASWAPNAVVSGPDVVFTVQGAAGRTIDWLLDGTVKTFAPGGLAE